MQFITDSNNIIQDANESFCRYFNYNTDELVGQHASIILSNISDKDSVLCFDPTDDYYPNIWEVNTKEGQLKFIAIETIPISTGEGEYSLTISFDLTKEGYRARRNSVNIKELKKYLINVYE